MHRTFSKLAIVGAAFAVLIGLTVLITGQPASKLSRQPASPHHVGIVDDWSFHHLVFSDPGTYEQAVKSGASYAKWLTIRYDTRFIMQQMKREAAMKQGGTIAVNGFPSATGGTEDLAIGLLRQLAVGPIRLPLPPPKPTSLKWDWSMNMGTGAKVGEARYPAKYSFNGIGSPACGTATHPDFVVYNTGLAGSSTQASIIAYDNLYSGTCTGTVPSTYWAYNTGDTIVTSVVLSGDGSQVAFADSTGHLVLLKWRANTTGRTVTGSLSASSPNVTITVGTFTQADVGARISGTGIPSPDYISSVLSSTTANLATAPTVHASETLTITAEAVATPGLPPTVATSAYHACTAPCMTSMTFSSTGTTTTDTLSSPFYDYAGDVIYVGDSNGYVHRFSGIFSGTPAETILTNYWPAHISVCALGSPVYDPVSLNVFVDAGTATGCTGGSFGGRFHRVPGGAGGGTVVSSATVANTGGPGWGDGPLVDPVAAKVYAFTNDDTGGHAGVVQFSTSFVGTDPITEEPLGQGSTTGSLYSGTFDNTYFTSSASSPTGNLYVCGRASGSQIPTIYRVPISGDVIGTPVVGPALASTTTTCSPVNEFLNGTTDRIFLSVEAGKITTSPISCPTSATVNGCIMAFNVTNITGWGTSKATSATALETGGTSGIVIDNAASSTGASQVYFSPLSDQSCPTSGGTGGCATQATQSALR